MRLSLQVLILLSAAIAGTARAQAAADSAVVRDTTTGKTMVQGMGASVLVNSTRHGYGKETPKERQRRK